MPEIWLGPNSDFLVYAKTKLHIKIVWSLVGLQEVSFDAWITCSVSVCSILLLDDILPTLLEQYSGYSFKQTFQNKYSSIMTTTAGLNPCSSLLEMNSWLTYVLLTD